MTVVSGQPRSWAICVSSFRSSTGNRAAHNFFGLELNFNRGNLFLITPYLILERSLFQCKQ